MATKPKTGWGIGYADTNVSGGFNKFKDHKSLATEIERMNTVIGNRSKQGLSNTSQTSYLDQLNKYQSELPKIGWGVGYGTPSGGKYIDYNDQDALSTELERMKTVIKNREAKGMDNVDNVKYLNNLQSMYGKTNTPTQTEPQQQAGMLDKYYNELTSKGFDFSKEYATKQAEAEAQALRDAIADGQRRNTTNRDENIQSIDNNLMNTADSLDRNYYLQGLNQMQNQVNSGMNGGVSQEQDLRMAMARQSDMAGAYRDANLGKMQANNAYTNNDLKYADQLGTVNQQALASAESMFQNNLQRGFQNALNLGEFDRVNQQQQSAQQMEMLRMLEDARRYDLEFGIAEGELTGNYLPSYLRGNPYNNPFTGGDLSGILSQYGIQSSSPSNNADMSSAYSQMTGLPQEGQNLFYEVLRQKQIAENPNSTPGEKQAANKVANELRNLIAAQGIDVTGIGAKTASYSDALRNISKLNPTLEKYQFDKELGARRYEFDQSLMEEGRQFDETMGFNYDELSQQDSQFNSQLEYEYEALRTQSELESRGLDLEEIRIESDQALADLKVTQEESYRYTQSVISKIMGFKNKEDAYDWIAENSESWGAQGVDVQAVIGALTERFSDSGGGGSADDYMPSNTNFNASTMNWMSTAVSSGLGNRSNPTGSGSQNHKGLDIAVGKGTPIGANVSGTVVYAGMGTKGSGYGGYGNSVAVKDSSGNVHLYAHLDSVNVKVGQRVNTGTLLGKSGNTGDSSGYHLHYEVRKNGQLGNVVNPSNYLGKKSPVV
jgi:murein DD-endopeptidase MepM/ murein hydrolase activator NlpD